MHDLTIGQTLLAFEDALDYLSLINPAPDDAAGGGSSPTSTGGGHVTTMTTDELLRKHDGFAARYVKDRSELDPVMQIMVNELLGPPDGKEPSA